MDREELEEAWRLKASNWKLSWEEFQNKEVVPQSRPFRAIIELTQNCNFKCKMCPQSWEEKFKKFNPELNMPMDVFVKICEQLFPYGVEMDLRGFGETTILPYWDEVLNYLENYPYINWHLVTNLSVPKDKMWDKMIGLGFQLGFSCDGATAQTMESIRVNSRMDVIRNNLSVIDQAVQKHKRGHIYFISTIQAENFHELRALVELANEFNVPEVQFKAVRGGDFERNFYAQSRENVKKWASDALDAALDLNVAVTFNDWFFTRDLDSTKLRRAEQLNRDKFWANFQLADIVSWEVKEEYDVNGLFEKRMNAARVSEHKACYKPMSFTYVNYEGVVGTCNHMIDPNMLQMGDLKTQDFGEIWTGDKYQEFRRQLFHNDPKDGRCQWCFNHRLDD